VVGNPTTNGEWAWISGSSAGGAIGVYGTLGVAAAGNVPGERDWAVSWTDSGGSFWLFGGRGSGSTGTGGNLNDLWEFTPSTEEWAWMSGSNAAGATGVYGTLGVPSISSFPGARQSAVSWKDTSGNLWLFGGCEDDSSGICVPYNDLWKFNPATEEWTWVDGSNTEGAYGSGGTPYVPMSRYQAVSWTDSSGKFWLFGGINAYGYIINDLLEYDPAANTWTWWGGSPTSETKGSYGTLGVASSSNYPGSRNSAIGWTDSGGNLWLFGGYGADSNDMWGDLNDLWEFNITTKQWTWIGGSSTSNASGVYGTLGVAAATNVPGARYSSVSWTDGSGNLWLFGGSGVDSTGAAGGEDLNDLWEFVPKTGEWAWVSGSDTKGATGVYGTLGVASAGNVPGERAGSVSWTDTGGNLWLFGGGELNDLWNYKP